VLMTPNCLFSQQEYVDTSLMARIREEGFVHSGVSHTAHYLTDVAGSRLTNSSGYRRAGQWVVSTLKEWGLQNVHLEPWGEFGLGWDLEKSSLVMLSPYYEPIIAYAKPWSGNTNGVVRTEVYLLQSDDSVSIFSHAAEIRGKLVLLPIRDTVIQSDFKADGYRYTDSDLIHLSDTYMIPEGLLKMLFTRINRTAKAVKYLQQVGALGLLSVKAGRDGTVEVDGFGGYLKKDQPQLPQMIVSTEAALKIRRLIHSGHPVILEMEVRSKLLYDDTKGYNVVGDIPGTDPSLRDQFVMLGGHMDSWQSSTGATDNGAGCIASLEAIRILKTLGIQPRRTIRIVLWGGEEQGLLGSFHYVKNHFGDPATMRLTPEATNVSAYFNLDNGSGKIRGIYDQSNEAVIPIFKKWLEPFEDLGATVVSPHNTGSTDHLSFDAVGIPGFQFVQDPLDYESRTHHTNVDNFDHLSIKDLQQAAIIIAAFVYNTAQRPERLPRKPLPKPEKFIFEEFEEAFR